MKYQRNDMVEFIDNNGKTRTGQITEGYGYRGISGCMITKYGNGSMGVWGWSYRISSPMFHDDGITPYTDNRGRQVDGIATVPARAVIGKTISDRLAAA